jgi:type IV pilus assembly protein PilB
MLTQSLLFKIATEKFNLTPSDLKDFSARAGKINKSVEQFLLDEGRLDEDGLYSAAASELGVPFVSLRNKEIKKEILNLIPPLLAQTHSMVAFDKTKKELYVAILDPEDIQTTEFIQKKVGLPLKIYLTTPRDIKETLRRYQ